MRKNTDNTSRQLIDKIRRMAESCRPVVVIQHGRDTAVRAQVLQALGIEQAHVLRFTFRATRKTASLY
jgi:2-methylisocitrate lyase-like PEP mutase family enzyme